MAMSEYQRFCQVLHDTVLSAKRAPELAAKLMISEPDLYGKLNPWQHDRELKIREFWRLLQHCDAEPIIRALAGAFGLRVEAAAPASDAATIEDECLDDYPALTAFHQAVRSGDVDASRALAATAQREIDETLSLLESRQYDPAKDGPGQVFKGGKLRAVGGR